MMSKAEMVAFEAEMASKIKMTSEIETMSKIEMTFEGETVF